MVTIREDPERAARVLQEAIDRDAELNQREPGVHAYDLLHCLRQGWARLRLETSARPTAQEDVRFAAMLLVGQGLHAWLESGEPEDHPILKLVIPGSGGRAVNVHCSVDRVEWGELPAGGQLFDRAPTGGRPWAEQPAGGRLFDRAPGEFKSTRYGSKKPLIEQAGYIDQLGVYALAYDIDWGVVYPLHLMGAYGADREPDFKAWVVSFDEAELAAWRRELTRRAVLLVGETLPPATEHDDYECQHCKLNVAFGAGTARGKGPLPTPDGWCHPEEGRRGQFFKDDNPEWAEG